jgi:hypothetical protein
MNPLYKQYCNQLLTLCENNKNLFDRLFDVINNPDLCDLLLDPTNHVLVLLQDSKNSGISKRRVKKYKLIRRLKNNPDYFEICDIIHNINEERKQIAKRLELVLNDLVMLNDSLIKFGEDPRSSKRQARKKFKTIHINIYDYYACEYDKRTDIEPLILDIQKNPSRRFPLYVAKSSVVLKQFLRHIYWCVDELDELGESDELGELGE